MFLKRRIATLWCETDGDSCLAVTTGNLLLLVEIVEIPLLLMEVNEWQLASVGGNC